MPPLPVDLRCVPLAWFEGGPAWRSGREWAVLRSASILAAGAEKRRAGANATRDNQCTRRRELSLEKMARKLVGLQCAWRWDVTVVGACGGGHGPPKLMDTWAPEGGCRNGDRHWTRRGRRKIEGANHGGVIIIGALLFIKVVATSARHVGPNSSTKRYGPKWHNLISLVCHIWIMRVRGPKWYAVTSSRTYNVFKSLRFVQWFTFVWSPSLILSLSVSLLLPSLPCTQFVRRVQINVCLNLLSLYLSVKINHHVRREGLEILTSIQKREEYTPLDFMKI
jgi:hypothetical protein